MRFSRAWLAAAPALALALSGGAAMAATASPAPSAARPAVVFSCLGKAEIRPKSFVLTCADGNSYLTRLTWSSWTAGAARGKGTWHVNDCVPNCAKGHFLSYPVDVEFWRSHPVKDRPGERYFTRLTMSETSQLRPGQS